MHTSLQLQRARGRGGMGGAPARVLLHDRRYEGTVCGDDSVTVKRRCSLPSLLPHQRRDSECDWRRLCSHLQHPRRPGFALPDSHCTIMYERVLCVSAGMKSDTCPQKAPPSFFFSSSSTRPTVRVRFAASTMDHPAPPQMRIDSRPPRISAAIPSANVEPTPPAGSVQLT